MSACSMKCVTDADMAKRSTSACAPLAPGFRIELPQTCSYSTKVKSRLATRVRIAARRPRPSSTICIRSFRSDCDHSYRPTHCATYGSVSTPNALDRSIDWDAGGVNWSGDDPRHFLPANFRPSEIPGTSTQRYVNSEMAMTVARLAAATTKKAPPPRLGRSAASRIVKAGLP